MATILSIINDIQGRLSLAQSGLAVGSSDLNVQQLLSMLNEEGRALRRRYPWEQTIFETSFASVAAESQGKLTTLADGDYDYILNDVLWNRTRLLPIIGPQTPKEWQAEKALTIGGIYGEYRIRGGELIVYPTMVAGDSVFFEYVSKNWLENAAGDTYYTKVNADTDTPLLDEEALTLGAKWRWLKSKGLEYAEDFNTYEHVVADLVARNGTKARINTNRRGINYHHGVVIPPGSWPVY